MTTSELDGFLARHVRSLPRICSKVTAERADIRRAAGKDVLELLPYPRLPLPPHVLEAAASAARENRGVPGAGSLGLREAVAAKVERETGWRVDPCREVVVTHGAMQALNVAFRALLDPGDEVLYPTPSYFFYGAVRLAGGVPVEVPTYESHRWEWDIAALEAAVTPRTKLLVVHTPTNPTGRVLSPELVDALIDLVHRHNLLLVCDESYDRLVYDGLRHYSPAAVPEARGRLILIQSLTKSYAMSPWRVGYLVAPAPLAAAFAKLVEWEELMCSHVGQAAAEAALNGPDDWLRSVPADFARQRDVLYGALEGIEGMSLCLPEGGPFLFVNVSGLGVSGRRFWAHLIDEYGVPSEPGSFFGSDSHVRLAFGADVGVLEEAGRRIRDAAVTVREEKEEAV